MYAFVSGFLCQYCFRGLATLSVAVACAFSVWYSILRGYHCNIFQSILLLMGIWVVSSLGYYKYMAMDILVPIW